MPMYKTQYDLQKIKELLIGNNIAMIFLERVQAIKGAGAGSTFVFGYGLGS